MTAPLPALLLIGPTGVGKSPLGDLLEELGLGGRRCFHFDFGANLRGVADTGRLPSTGQAPGRLSTADTEVIEAALRTGALLENEHFHIAGDLLLSFADQRQVTTADLLVLNGLPRHVGQARDVDGIVQVQRLVVLEATAEVIGQRLSLDTGGDRAGRVDDDPGLVRHKLATYRERTAPLVRHYDAGGATIHHLEVGVETTALDLVAQLSDRSMAEVPLSDYGAASRAASPVSRMMADFAATFRDGVDINLGVGYVNERTLPRREVREALGAVLDQPERYRAALNYGGPRGSENLRESVRAFLLEGCQQGLTGELLDQREILIGPNGATSLLESLALLLRRGIAVVADPMYYIYCDYLQRLGFEVMAVPEDEGGMSAEGLRELLEQLGPRRDEVSFIYVITVHNPTGTVLTNQRRRDLLRIAGNLSTQLSRRVPLVLDRAYEDLIHDPGVERPCSALPDDEHGITYEVGTLSKILAPGLRIGYMVAPPGPLVDALVQRTSDAGFSAPLVNQEIASYLLERYAADQVRHVNEGYRTKALQVSARIDAALGEHLLEKRGGQAGFYYYLALRDVQTGPASPFFRFLSRQTGDPAADGSAEQPRARVVYIPGEFCVHPRGQLVEAGQCQLRISYGFEEIDRIGQALDHMAEAIRYTRRRDG